MVAAKKGVSLALLLRAMDGWAFRCEAAGRLTFPMSNDAACHGKRCSQHPSSPLITRLGCNFDQNGGVTCDDQR